MNKEELEQLKKDVEKQSIEHYEAYLRAQGALQTINYLLEKLDASPKDKEETE